MLKQLRKRMRIKQHEMAAILSVSQRTIGTWERSNNAPLYAMYAYEGVMLKWIKNEIA